MAQTLKEWFESPEFKELEKLDNKTLMHTNFFRDSCRATMIDEDYFFSPADGIITFQKEIKSVKDSIINVKGKDYTVEIAFGKGIEITYPCKVINVFMTAFDCHLNRMPTAGLLKSIDIGPIASYNKPMLEHENKLFKDKFTHNDSEYLFNNERVLNEVYITNLNYRYWFTQIADYDVGMIVNFESRKSASMLQSERMGIIRWGSSCQLLLPSDDRFDFEFVQLEHMHVKAGYDPLIKIIKK